MGKDGTSEGRDELLAELTAFNRVGLKVKTYRRGNKNVVRKTTSNSPGPPSEAQIEVRNNLTEAAKVFLPLVRADPEMMEYYKSLPGPGSWSAKATRDYLISPIITKVDVSGYRGHPGGSITIQILDDSVKSVQIRIIDPTPGDLPPEEGELGVLVEEGFATPTTPPATSAWEYRTTAELNSKDYMVMVEAKDFPGNATQAVVEQTLIPKA